MACGAHMASRAFFSLSVGSVASLGRCSNCIRWVWAAPVWLRRMAGPALAQLLFVTAVFAQDPVFSYETNDSEMNNAILQARATLPEFYDWMASDEYRFLDGMLKVGIPYETAEGPSKEHVWVFVKDREDSEFLGLIANAPAHIPQRRGDHYPFTEDAISDWTYTGTDGKRRGSYTIRVMLSRMSPDRAARIEAGLAPLTESPEQ